MSSQDSGLASTAALSLKQARSLSDTIGNAILKARAQDYAEFAEILVDRIEQARAAANDEVQQELRADLVFFGKLSRQLDLILGVSNAAGYLQSKDRVAALAICRSVEKKLGTYAEDRSAGILRFPSKNGAVNVRLRSSVGRAVAALLSKIVPPSTDAAMQSLPQTAFLSEDTNAAIRADLEAAVAHAQSGRTDEAIKAFRSVLGRDRKNVEALYLLGRVYRRCGDAADAIPYLDEARRLLPKREDVLLEYGLALLNDRQDDKAIKAFEEGLKNNPGSVNLLVCLTLGLFFMGDDAKALALLDDGLKKHPNSADILAHLGGYYYGHYDFEKAMLYYSRAVKAEPRNAYALHGYAVLLSDLRKGEEALSMIDRAMTVAPDDADTSFTKALILLDLGKYEEGWKLHEGGLYGSKNRRLNFLPGKSVWTGDAMPGKALLIHAEQGLGDGIQFVRYASLCKEKVGKVYVLCPPGLKRLFACCPGVDKVFTSIWRWKVDAQIAMMSLPHIFGTTLATVPAKVPYFVIPEKHKKRWAKKLALPDGKIRVGLVWSGSMFSGVRRGDLRARRRNVGLEKLLPLFDFEDVAFCNLQKGKEAEDIDTYKVRSRMVDVMADAKDMLDTAAIIENLDLVISVDTSVAHLAGALNKPVWIMSRYDACWRWLHNRPANPWYPSARIFGQPESGNWDSVVAEVKTELGALISKVNKD